MELPGGGSDHDPPLVGVPAGEAEAGEVLGGRRDPVRLQAADEGVGHLRIPRAGVREGARAEEVARRAGRVDDRREVDVDPDGAERRRSTRGLGVRDGWARHVGGRLGRRSPGEPPDEPAFLVDRDQERLAARARRLLQFGRDGCGGVAREPAVAEQNDAAHLPVANPRQEPPVRGCRERPHHGLGGVGEAGAGRVPSSGPGSAAAETDRNRRHGDETHQRPQHRGQGSPGFAVSRGAANCRAAARD